jgi:prepilin-type N-terminal cleavage/methylation domain-containing protein/prepilin-type processing-associated H-X9-DG protein
MRENSMNRSHRKKGFTLIELLVVVAIIAVLIAILLPALGSARQRANEIVCQNNMRSSGQASSFFANENNERLEVYHNLPNSTVYSLPGEYYWSNLLIAKKYLPDHKSLLCPTMKPTADEAFDQYRTFGARIDTLCNTAYSQPGRPSEYFMEVSIKGSTLYRNDYIQINRISDFSRFFYIADSVFPPGWGDWTGTQNGCLYFVAGATSAYMCHSNGQTLNAWFFDGHAAALNRGRFLNFAKTDLPADPNNDHISVRNMNLEVDYLN